MYLFNFGIFQMQNSPFLKIIQFSLHFSLTKTSASSNESDVHVKLFRFNLSTRFLQQPHCRKHV